MTSASVVVLTYNSAGTLGACLDTLIPQLAEAGANLVVVDNGSVDESLELATSRDVTTIDAGSNLGFAAGCNLGAAGTAGEVLVFVNPDATLHPGTLRRLVDDAATQRHGPIGGTARHVDGTFDERCALGRPSLGGALAFATGLDTAFRGNRWLDPEFGLTRLPDGATEVEVVAISGAVMAIDRGLWNQLGGFNDDFFVYGEDVDLCLRSAELGRQPILAVGADYQHVGGMQADATLQRRRLLFRGKAELYDHHLTGPARSMATASLVAGSLLRGARSMLPGGSSDNRSRGWLELFHDRNSWRHGHTGASPALQVAPSSAPSDGQTTTSTQPVGSQRPTASIVIPAHDEDTSVTDTLVTLLADAADDEFEVIVVCNGCNDDTAAHARSVDGVSVEELTTASKIHALQRGDEVATTFPRIYLDADVTLTTAAARSLVAAVAGDVPRVAGVVGHMDTTESGIGTRWYFDFRQRLPVFHNGIIGAGVYAMNQSARCRFDVWPDVTGDDQFVYRLFAPTERVTVSEYHTVVCAPPDLVSVVNRQLRVRRGNAQLSATETDSPNLPAPSAGVSQALKDIRTTPRAWPGAVTWVAVNLAVRVAARVPRLQGDWS